MQINLSDNTINTVYKALKSRKNALEKRITDVTIGKASREMEPIYRKRLEEVKDALLVFEELIESDS